VLCHRAAGAAFDSPGPGPGGGRDITGQFNASVAARLTIPIYEGGEVQARTRQAKETAGQRRLEADAARDQVRAAVISSWDNTRPPARKSALHSTGRCRGNCTRGRQEEARVGQRTTLDVLNAQQELLTRA
jgi:outer membrane protein